MSKQKTAKVQPGTAGTNWEASGRCSNIGEGSVNKNVMMIFYRAESDSAREYAESLGVEYEGFTRLCTVNCNASMQGLSKALSILAEVEKTSDRFALDSIQTSVAK